MSVIEFRVPCRYPTTTHHSKKIVKAGKFSKLADTDKLNDAKATVEALILPYRPATPVEGAIRLTIEITWPWRKSEAKKVIATGKAPRLSKPDCSNLAKTLEDRLVVHRFMADDNAVTELIVRKYWGDEPGLYVRIESI